PAAPLSTLFPSTTLFRSAGYRQYVMGYLTAYNALANETYSISADQDLDAVMGWLSTYCEDKPMHSFDQALMDYTSSHVADRLKRSEEHTSELQSRQNLVC